MVQQPGNGHRSLVHALRRGNALQCRPQPQRRRLLTEQTATAQRRPGHDRQTQALRMSDLPVHQAAGLHQPDFNLVGQQPVFHGGLQQIQVPGHEVGHASCAHLAALDQAVQTGTQRVVIHQRVRAVNQQQVNGVNADVVQRALNAGLHMGAGGVVMFDAVVWPLIGQQHDVALGDDFHARLQARLGPQGRAEQSLAAVAAVNVGMVKSRDALVQAGLNAGGDCGGRRVGRLGQAPDAIGQPAERQVRIQFNAGHVHRRVPKPKGVAGVLAGTRP